MAKLVFIHYMKFTREYNQNSEELDPAEWERYQSIAKKHGLKVYARGTPWGNEYHGAVLLEADKGMDAWNGFIGEYVAGSWKYILESRTDIISKM